MAKNRSRRDDNLRRQIAYRAARLMAEEGIADYGTAKQKAARQAGLAEAASLPDNREVEAALREFQELYQSEEQPLELQHLREVAIEVMRELAPFRPFLVGAVLNGTANRFSEIALQVYTDDAKALMLFLVNRRRPFETDEKRVRIGDAWAMLPQMRFEVDGAPVVITVYGEGDERIAPKPRGEGDGPQRARLAEAEALFGP